MQKNKLWLFIVFFAYAPAFSQQFSHAAKLDEISDSRFYAIDITSALTAHLDPSFKDLRIIDSKGTPVPYIVKSNLPALSKQDFHPLTVLENTLKDSGRSYIVVENTTGKNINGFALVIRNAAVSRTAKISGSDDNKHWFTVNENVNFGSGRFSDKDRFVLALDMPPSSYRYFRIVIDNQKNDPLNIVEIGEYASAPGEAVPQTKPVLKFLTDPAPRIEQKDSSDGYSYIHIIQTEPYHVSAARISVSEPRFFRRTMEVLPGNARYGFILTPGTSGNEFSFPRFAAKEWTIRIFNGDNPPLKIANIDLMQEQVSALVFLEKGESYRLLLGNSKAEIPSYDLEAFKDSIPANPDRLNFQAIQANIQAVASQQSKSKIFLWVIIAGVLSLLSFFTWKLTRDLKHRQ